MSSKLFEKKHLFLTYPQFNEDVSKQWMLSKIFAAV